MQIFKTSVLSIDKVGAPGGEAYLVRTDERALLYDSGFAYSAPDLVGELDELLNGRILDYLFLSHSHYDHASGSVWVKQRWPEVTICGSAHAARVLTRPGAQETILNLNREAAQEALAAGRADSTGIESVNFGLLNTLHVNQIVQNGSVLDMESVKLEVIESPGHTRCSLMLWCAEEALLLGSESLGVFVNEDMVIPACLTGYFDSLETIRKAQALQPQHILLNHREVVSGSDAAQYLENALHWTEKTAHLVWECDSIGMSQARIASILKGIFFIQDLKRFQPEAAFDLNNALLIEHLLACQRQGFSPSLEQS